MTTKVPIEQIDYTKALVEGMILNGKIVPSIASNNLTLALKGVDGNDPSATNPVYVRINSVTRTITAALSVTLNAGTNWFSHGSAVTAAQDIDYFVFLAWDNSNSAVRIGFARIPYPILYSEFSATTTNQRYGAFNTAPSSGDSVVNVGRFRARLSAGAGYTWSIPNVEVINYPVFATDTLSFNMVVTAGTGWGITTGLQYQIIMDTVTVRVTGAGALSGTAGSAIVWTLPLTHDSTNESFLGVAGNYCTAGAHTVGLLYSDADTRVNQFKSVDQSNYPNTGNLYCGLVMIYKLN